LKLKMKYNNNNNILFILILGTLLICSQAYQFQLVPHLEKCVRDDFREDTLIQGRVDVEQRPSQLSFKVLDPHQNPVFQNNDIQIGTKFSFTTQGEGDYFFCFTDSPMQGLSTTPNRMVTLTFDTEEKKDYAELAKREHLKPMEVELRKMEDLAQNIRNDFSSLKKREARHRDTSESTNSRVFWMSSLSIVIVIGLALTQLYYLKRYFKSKKLI